MDADNTWESHRENYSTLQEEYDVPDLDTVIDAFSLSPDEIEPSTDRLLPSIVDAVVKNVLSLTQDMQNHLTGRTLLYQATDTSLPEAESDRLQELYIDLASDAWHARATKYKNREDQADWLNTFLEKWEDRYRDDVIWFCEYVADQWADAETEDNAPTPVDNPLFG